MVENIQTGCAEIKATPEKKANGIDRLPRQRKRFADHMERIEVGLESEDPADCGSRLICRRAGRNIANV